MRVRLALEGDVHHESDAIVFGDWAAHKTPLSGPRLGPEGWRVTHRPSGCCLRDLADDLTRDDAVHIAHNLARFMVGMPYPPPAEWRYLVEAAIGEVLGGVRWYP